VLGKCPYLKKEECISVIETPTKVEPQEHNFRFWGKVEELEGKFLRVTTLADKLTIYF